MSDKHKFRVINGGKAIAPCGRYSIYSLAKTEEERRKREKDRAHDIEKNGSAAEKRLLKFRRQTIPMADRRQMAVNMDGLLRKYRISPTDLPWEKDYDDPKQFYNALGRCRLKSISTPKARLNAYPFVWLRIISYVFETLQQKHGSISRNALVEQLVWGTKFHPLKQKLTPDDLLISALWATGDEIARKQGLMPHYRNSAKLRADYYKTHGRLISHKPFMGFKPSFFVNTLGDIHCAHLWANLPNKRFIDLTPEEWDKLRPELEVNQPNGELYISPLLCNYMEWYFGREELLNGSHLSPGEEEANALEELSLNIVDALDLRTSEGFDSIIDKRLCDLSDLEWARVESRSEHFRNSYQYLQYCIQSWNGFRSEERAIDAFVNNVDFPIEAVTQFPRAFLGIFNYDLPDAETPEVSELSDPFCEFVATGFTTRTAEKWLGDTSKTDYDALAELVYLVLIPNFERNQLVPHLCLCFDGSSIREITLELLSDTEFAILPPFEASEPLVVKSIREIVIDEIERIIGELRTTATHVCEHDPYTNFENSRIERLEKITSELWTGKGN